MKRHETAELSELRSILRSIGLEETVKSGGPVYTYDGKNLVGLGGFKSYFGLWFFQGALLADKKKLLINAQAGRTKALRQIRFRSMDEIDRRSIAGYVKHGGAQIVAAPKGCRSHVWWKGPPGGASPTW